MCEEHTQFFAKSHARWMTEAVASAGEPYKVQHKLCWRRPRACSMATWANGGAASVTAGSEGEMGGTCNVIPAMLRFRGGPDPAEPHTSCSTSSAACCRHKLALMHRCSRNSHQQVSGISVVLGWRELAPCHHMASMLPNTDTTAPEKPETSHNYALQ